ncbi:MAG TPA: cupin domain-containing protein [Gaiellaceae bacterium]
MPDEARLEETGSGLAPATDGWFVVNVRDTAWYTHRGAFGSRCGFESREAPFPQLGINIRVLEPARPNCLYHRESLQEDFLVLAGECILLVNEEERRLEAWDFVHMPPGVEHVFVGAGDGPCVILMTGARSPEEELFYPVSELAGRYGASADSGTESPDEAYAKFGHHEPGRPASWDALPWT